MTKKISISSFIHEDTANGPGIRTTIFVQGCEIHCPGCQNKSTWNIEDGTWMTVDEILQEVEEHTAKNPEKLVTISGGEPTLQFEALTPLLEQLRARGYEILLFTGLTYGKLALRMATSQQEPNKNVPFTYFISLCDLIKAGPWVADKHDYDILFRGSTNQRYYKVIREREWVRLKDVTEKIDAQEDWKDE